MSLTIRHNIGAINTQRNLALTDFRLGKSLEKLSSGYRINTGSDGPADLIISEQLRAQSGGLERAVRNTREAMNVFGIAEGALIEMNAILKKMRALSLHALNSGITSPAQILADQSEVDSGIQTIDRIANTTRYSNQLLLNGGKSINFERTTTAHSTQQNSLINAGLSHIDQILKRDNFQITVGFSGTRSPDVNSAVGDANLAHAARKAYFEIDSNNGEADVSSTGSLTASSGFIITGNKGSRLFNFDVGATMGQIASAINNVADSTGIDASLIFASNMTSSQSTNITTVDSALGSDIAGPGGFQDNTEFFIYNNIDDSGNGVITNLPVVALTGVILGQNTDGHGRIYIRVTGNNSYELYKDSSLSKESLIGHGVEGAAVIADNNSGLSNFTISTIANGNAGHVSVLAADKLAGNAGIDYSGSFSAGIVANTFRSNGTSLNGVELGRNTDSEGRLYLKTVINNLAGGGQGTVYVYRDSRMADEDLVAMTKENIDLGGGGNILTIIANEVKNDDGTAGTGLGMALSSGADWTAVGEYTGEIQFTRLGVRISSQEYGSDQFVKVQAKSGSVFQYYQQPDSNAPTLVSAGVSGTTVQQNGGNATVSINGRSMETSGLNLNLSTQDVQARLVFNEGRVGSTTIAQVGYTDGSAYTRAGILTNTSTADFDDDGVAAVGSNTITDLGGILYNPGHVTNETLGSFQSGMRLQLGEGSGDQERTVFGIETMSVANLGTVSFTGEFDPSKAVIETRELSLMDVLGGNLASLGVDPVRALTIIDKAIEDVTTLRARIGAAQANLLQTNANSLQVAIENIYKTEQHIRDADMAAETTELARNQILLGAATSILAQANVMSLNVLELLV